MKKSLMLIVLVIITSISGYSQQTFIQTHYRHIDSTLVIKTSVFDLLVPKKVEFNTGYGVLMGEVHMDSINLKYLRFKVLESKYDAINIELEKSRKENEKLMVSVDFLTKDNSRLKLINTTLTEQFDIKQKQHDTEVELWKAKARGRFKSLLLGTGLGALVVALLTFL